MTFLFIFSKFIHWEQKSNDRNRLFYKICLAKTAQFSKKTFFFQNLPRSGFIIAYDWQCPVKHVVLKTIFEIIMFFPPFLNLPIVDEKPLLEINYIIKLWLIIIQKMLITTSLKTIQKRFYAPHFLNPPKTLNVHARSTALGKPIVIFTPMTVMLIISGSCRFWF